jgi:hypothetical protein
MEVELQSVLVRHRLAISILFAIFVIVLSGLIEFGRV